MIFRRIFRNNKKRNTHTDLAQAEHSLRMAVAAREDQARKQEREVPLLQRLDHAAASNHLAHKFLEAFTERHA